MTRATTQKTIAIPMTMPSAISTHSSAFTLGLADGGKRALDDAPAQRPRDQAHDDVERDVADHHDDQPGHERPALVGAELLDLFNQYPHLVEHKLHLPPASSGRARRSVYNEAGWGIPSHHRSKA